MKKLTMVSWYWEKDGGANKHAPEHVTILRNMVRRHLRLDHEFVCITNRPEKIDPSIRTIPLWEDLLHSGYCTVRLRAFAPEMREIIGPRFAWLDLDVVIVDDITPIFDCASDFKISGVELREQPYNGSIVLMDAGARPQVFSTFDPVRLAAVKAEKNYGGTDQAWIAVCLGEREEIWTKRDGIYNYREHIDPPRPVGNDGALPKNARIVVMNGRFSPASPKCQEKSPWIKEFWR
jgi:hypothetical protein